jgi:hypothetical protein
LPQAIYTFEIATAPAVRARMSAMLTPVSLRPVGARLHARIACAVLVLGGALLSAPTMAQVSLGAPAPAAAAVAPPVVLNSADDARAVSRDATARIGELDARYKAEETACMKTFFANSCANRAREAYLKEKADLQVVKQHAELYLRVDADNTRRARVAENLRDAEEDAARRTSAPPAEPKTPKPAKAPTPTGRTGAIPSAAPTAAPGSSPLTDLGPLPSMPTDSRGPAPIVNTPPAPKPDDSAQRAENRENFERKTEDARRYAEEHEVRAAKAAADRERRRAAREVEAKRLEGAAGPAVAAPIAPAR